mmetsp:Transcript_58403/g.183327  ORF Transcript_58403/g.183327 Transcript_58403/m.183327 type:complete len:207 (-) Transcript_58403:70-690(-)
MQAKKCLLRLYKCSETSSSFKASPGYWRKRISTSRRCGLPQASSSQLCKGGSWISVWAWGTSGASCTMARLWRCGTGRRLTGEGGIECSEPSRSCIMAIAKRADAWRLKCRAGAVLGDDSMRRMNAMKLSKEICPPSPTCSMTSSIVYPSGRTSTSGPSPDSTMRNSWAEIEPSPSRSNISKASRTAFSEIVPSLLVPITPARNSV